MVGEVIFSETQRPEILQSRSYPGQWSSFVKNLTAANQPMSYTGDGLAEKGKRRLKTIEAARPAPDG